MKEIYNNILILVFIISMASCVLANEKDFSYNSKGNRDPFLTLVTQDGRILPGARAVSDTDDIELEGIIWDPNGKSMAILNGKLVKEKQRIMNMQVLLMRMVINL